MREKSNPVTAGFWLIKKKIPWKSLPVFGPECPTAVLTKVLARMNIVSTEKIDFIWVAVEVVQIE